jgi:hypothetical protein
VSIATDLRREYGPIAFGLVSLLLLWKGIVVPELAAVRTSVAQQTLAIYAARDAARASETAAQVLVDALSRMESRL